MNQPLFKSFSGFSLAVVLGVPLMGASGNGCSGEYTNNGTSSAWPTGIVPTPAATALPMSCEWLASDNCWKKTVAKVVACTGDFAQRGTFDTDREACSYSSGATWEFGGAIGTPGSGTTQFEAVDWRLVSASQQTCATGKILGIGETILDVGGDVTYFQNPSLTSFRVTCSDGTTYGNDIAGSCSDIGAQWLAHKTPGVLMTCQGDKKTCDLGLWGGPSGEAKITTCGW